MVSSSAVALLLGAAAAVLFYKRSQSGKGRLLPPPGPPGHWLIGRTSIGISQSFDHKFTLKNTRSSGISQSLSLAYLRQVAPSIRARQLHQRRWQVYRRP